ncbi:MAG TPA: hypothetical protein VFQ67_16645 [Allosphingosinicella sp.]|nr:hypothetical protein [Allosphingosinicella sp.]
MTDVSILFSSDKKPDAERIAQAFGEAGYEATLAEIGTDAAGIAERARGAPAVLLVWSRPLVSSAMAGDWLAGLRQLPNLIEVSTDGIAPDAGDSGRVVLLSGWRGQPHHLGWQRIVEALKRLRAPRPVRTAAQRTPVLENGARSGRNEAAAGAPGSGRRFVLPALAAAAALAAVGALTWSGSGAPGPGPARRANTAAAAPTGVPERPRMEPAAPAAPVRPAVAAAAPPPAPTTEARASGERVAPPRPAPIRTEARPGRLPPQRTRALAAPAPLKRYSKRHSKTMRLFCARSGRSTPQCRTFLRSVEASRS